MIKHHGGLVFICTVRKSHKRYVSVHKKGDMLNFALGNTFSTKCLPFRSLMPGWTFPVWRGVEIMLAPVMSFLAMFAQITLKRTDA